MTWYDKAKYRYPKGYMTLVQLDLILQLGLIDQAQYDGIKALKSI